MNVRMLFDMYFSDYRVRTICLMAMIMKDVCEYFVKVHALLSMLLYYTTYVCVARQKRRKKLMLLMFS